MIMRSIWDGSTLASSAQLRITERSALNLGYTEWGKFLGNAPLVAALLSRLLQKCQTISIVRGTNLRDPKIGCPTSAQLPDILKIL